MPNNLGTKKKPTFLRWEILQQPVVDYRYVASTIIGLNFDQTATRTNQTKKLRDFT